MKSPVLFLVGPTAVGKSKIALEVARELCGEIVSADSMQIYRGMDIGTAKPSQSELALIPHHLIDILEPSETFSAFEFYQKALAAIRLIYKKGKIPIIAGGTGFYIRTLLNGISPEAGDAAEIRKKLEEDVKERGLNVLYEDLKKIDPVRAGKIMPQDKKRILRALEIYGISGKKPSEMTKNLNSLEDQGFAPVVIGLTLEREVLYRRIEKRVEQMFENGLVKEVQQLKNASLSKTARQAVGYKEILDFYKERTGNGEIPQDKIKEEIKKNTRHLAKRQWTWFRKEKGIEWLDAADPAISEVVLSRFREANTPQKKS